MCRFCGILESGLKQKWFVRSTYAEDNFNEFTENGWWDKDSYFLVGGLYVDGEMRVSIEYFNKLSSKYEPADMIIHPFSESAVFNYCPSCGKELKEQNK